MTRPMQDRVRKANEDYEYAEAVVLVRARVVVWNKGSKESVDRLAEAIEESDRCLTALRDVYVEARELLEREWEA